MLNFSLQADLPEFALDVTLEVGRETLVLIGPSGCGKSTTLSMLAGIRAADRGRIALDGRTLFDPARRIDVVPERRRFGYVLQQYALFPHLDVRANILYGIRTLPRERRVERLERVVSMLRIGALLEARPSQISGGERQRVAIARALVTEPQALLLDEPLAALDIEHRSRIRLELLDVLKALDTPTVVVSHEYEDARILGDRIAVMHRGRIVQVGTAIQLGRQPADAFVARFCGTNLARATIDGVETAVAFDPWRAHLARERTAAPYEWAGRVVDVARLGSALRVHVEGDHSLFADLSVEEGEATFRAGDAVFLSVGGEHLRPTVAPREAIRVP
ncbi:MAG: hypothetical protein NVSMB21_16520 [Vulcanimicrobiaceae bacterium]